MPELILAEKDKKAGVFYALSDDGVELPVIDMTHPAFAFNPGPQELKALEEKFLATEKRREKMPAFFNRLILRLVLGKSTLAKGLSLAQHSFLRGMDTYLMKLGAENLGRAYTVPVDKKIAASFPALAMRMRLQDMARLMGGHLVPQLAASPTKALHFINIAGGTAMDSLNCLILINKKHGPKLEKRAIFIHILDMEEAAPHFAGRALEAFQTEGGPLRGLEIHLRHLPYDWRRASYLEPLLGGLDLKESLVAISSEGGLFEYGSDEEIIANLGVFRHLCPPDAIAVGSVTRHDGPSSYLRRNSHILIHPRPLEDFESLVQKAGWKLETGMQRAFSHNILLVQEAS